MIFSLRSSTLNSALNCATTTTETTTTMREVIKTALHKLRISFTELHHYFHFFYFVFFCCFCRFFALSCVEKANSKNNNNKTVCWCCCCCCCYYCRLLSCLLTLPLPLGYRLQQQQQQQSSGSAAAEQQQKCLRLANFAQIRVNHKRRRDLRGRIRRGGTGGGGVVSR